MLCLHLRIAAVIGKARRLADREAALKIGRWVAGAEDEVAGANGIGRAFGLQATRPLRIDEGLTRQFAVGHDGYRVEIDPNAGERKSVAYLDRRTGGRVGRKEFSPDRL